MYESEESDDDETDSDISIDENDEPKSDNEDEGPKKKRRVVTKAYKVCFVGNHEMLFHQFDSMIIRNSDDCIVSFVLVFLEILFEF